ncbi:hypothetical protein ACWGPC_56605, partial [Streptomyces mirabilis]
MTDHHAADAHQQADRHLQQALDELLDVEAGLSEVLLHSRHDKAVDDLDVVLDTEAGLAAILPAAETEPVLPAGSVGAEEFLHGLSPEALLALRRHPAVRTTSDALACALGRAPAPAPASGLDLAFDLILDVARALARA